MLQTWTAIADGWPKSGEFELWDHQPLLAVSSITYKDQNGDMATVDTSVYAVELGVPAKIYLKPSQSWPGDSLWPRGAITITFTSGYSSDCDIAVQAAAVPSTLRDAVKRHAFDAYEHPSIVASAFENRSAVQSPSAEMMEALRRYVSHYKIHIL
jgi:uncharacterized phiE125 gp8 family phage protein